MQSLIILGAYLFGSISFAVVVSRVLGLPDPRTYGSKNPGATNVLRTGNKTAAALTLLGDGGKGYAAVALAALFPADSETVVPLCGLAVFLGHLFPVFHRFRGGKGVATAAGVLFGLDAWLGLGALATWMVIAALFRFSSLASLAAALFAPLYTFWLFGLRPFLLGAVCAVALLLIWRHKENIGRLLRGEERRIGGNRHEGSASPGP